jgi:restriction system protein
MAKRKSLNKQRDEAINGLIALILFGSFFFTYSKTKSLAAAAVVAGLVLAVGISILIMIGMQRAERLRRSGISEIDKMDGHRFEHYLGHLFKSQGYITEVTKAVGDYGADIVLSGHGKRIVVQAKRYGKNVGLKAVQEVHTAIAHYRAAEGWVVTNSDYTDQAYTLAKSNGVRLINRAELIEMILKMNTPVKTPGVSTSG